MSSFCYIYLITLYHFKKMSYLPHTYIQYTHTQRNTQPPLLTPGSPLCLPSLVADNIARRELICSAGVDFTGLLCHIPMSSGHWFVVMMLPVVYISHPSDISHGPCLFICTVVIFRSDFNHFLYGQVSAFKKLHFEVKHKTPVSFLIYVLNPGWKFTLHHCNTMILYLSLWSCT